MKKLSSLDQKILNHKVEKVFDLVSNYETYKIWFPESIKLNLVKSTPNKIGSVIEICTGFVKFYCELIRINSNKELVVHYSGAYEGRGIWYFFESLNGTKLIYEIDLEIKNPFVFLVSLFLDLSHIHSKMMTNIFFSLEKYLNELYNVNGNSVSNNSNTQPKIFTLTGN